MQNILITGANGQLGSEFKSLSEQYKYLNFFFTDITDLDITNPKAVYNFINNNKIDITINCAAYTAVDKAEEEKELASKINITGAKVLAENAKKTNSLLVHISTDYVFDGKNYKPYIEKDKLNPLGIYGLTKYKGEQAIIDAKTRSIIIRTSWLYSSFGNNFVKTMLKLGMEKAKVSVIFDQLGTPTYARDLAKAILQIIQSQKIQNISSCIYHFSNEGAISWYDFAMAIMEIANLECKVLPIESKEFQSKTERPYYSVLNKTKIKHDFDIEIPYWKDSLKKCIEIIKSN